jgi:hypothetical protein
MPRAAPEAGCYDLAFQAAYPLGEPAEVALEDYARVLTRSRGAEAVRADDDPSMVTGVHVCGLGVSLTQATLTDIEDFARQMTAPAEGSGGLGWS